MAVSLGYGPDGKTWRRHKVSGRTRAEVAEELKRLQAELDSGMQPERAYTVQRAVDDWLAEGLDGRSARTVRLNYNVLKLVTAVIGGIELRMLTAHDVRRALRNLDGRGACEVHAARVVQSVIHRCPLAYHFCTREDRRTPEPGVIVMNLAVMLGSRLPWFAPVLQRTRK